MEFYVIKNWRGHYFKSKKHGWVPTLEDALLLTNLDVLSDLLTFDKEVMFIEKLKFKNIGGSKVKVQVVREAFGE